MPKFRSRTRTRTRTRRPRRRSYGKRSKKNYKRYGMGDMIMYKGIGLPDAFFTKLKYASTFNLSAAALTPYQQYQFRGNSAYDPDFTGGGNQPTYYDQLCTATGPYVQYLVYASKIKVRFNAVGDTYAIGNADVAVTPSISAIGATGWADVDDQIDIQETKSTATSRMDGAGAKYIKHFAKTKDVFTSGASDLSVNQAVWAGSYNGNPTGVWYWIIGGQGMDRTSTTMNIGCHATITYYVKFITKYQEPQS